MNRAGASLAAAALVAFGACTDVPDSACLEPDATPYAYHWPGDSGTVFRWPAGRMPLRVYAEPAGTLPATTETGARVWAYAVRCGEVSFRMVGDSAAADIVVRNPEVLPAAPPAGIAAAAESVGACTGRTDLDTLAGRVVRPVRVWVVPNSSVADTAAVSGCYRFTVAHELGHAIGLLSHSPNADDLMFASPYRRLATPNDRFTVQLLYRATPTLSPAP